MCTSVQLDVCVYACGIMNEVQHEPLTSMFFLFVVTWFSLFYFVLLCLTVLSISHVRCRLFFPLSLVPLSPCPLSLCPPVPLSPCPPVPLSLCPPVPLSPCPPAPLSPCPLSLCPPSPCPPVLSPCPPVPLSIVTPSLVPPLSVPLFAPLLPSGLVRNSACSNDLTSPPRSVMFLLCESQESLLSRSWTTM